MELEYAGPEIFHAKCIKLAWHLRFMSEAF